MKAIFHGDDFGLTSGINKGIIRSFRKGLLSSTSLIAGGEAAEEAISLAKEHPELDVGVHLIICDEKPVLSPVELPSITSGASHFPSRKQIQKAILAREINYREVEAEWNAQVEKVLDAGIPISHLDGHQFIHLFPGLLPACLRIAENYQVSFVRASSIDLLTIKVGFKRIIQWLALKLWIRLFVSRSLPSNIRVPPSVGFLEAGGRMKSGSVLKTIDTLRNRQSSSMVEFIFHPGTGDTYTSHKYGHWHYDWKKDLELLTDRSLKESLDLRGVVLTSFREEL